MIRDEIKNGKIVFVPLNGTPNIVAELPEDMQCHYSGPFVILSGPQDPDGDENITIKKELGVKVIGDAVVVSQEIWHHLVYNNKKD